MAPRKGRSGPGRDWATRTGPRFFIRAQDRRFVSESFALHPAISDCWKIVARGPHPRRKLFTEQIVAGCKSLERGFAIAERVVNDGFCSKIGLRENVHPKSGTILSGEKLDFVTAGALLLPVAPAVFVCPGGFTPE